MRLISFDVGTQNMAFAVCQPTQEGMLLERTGRQSFPRGLTINQLASLIVDWCFREFGDCQWDAVLIENQLGTRMKAVQTALLTHFATIAYNTGREVVGVSPKCKLRGCSKDVSYSQRKAYCVEQYALRCKTPLADKKQDDICDAVMQAFEWCVNRDLLTSDARIIT